MNVVITGGGRGFGRTIARRFVQQGATVVVTARDLTAAQRTCASLPDAHALQCDLTDAGSIRDCAEQVGELLGHVDVLVNNGAAFLAESQADDDAIVRTILSGTAGTVLMTESFLPLLRRSERADVVTIVSLEAESRIPHTSRTRRSTRPRRGRAAMRRSCRNGCGQKASG